VGGNHFNLLVKYLRSDFGNGTEIFESSSDYNMRVIRFWASCSNSYWSDQCLFYGPNNWNSSKEDFFAGFDRLVSDAEKYNIYLIPVLIDGYGTFRLEGDGTQVCQVGGGSNALYKEFVKDVVARYKDRSIILAWEIGNEGHLYCSSDEDLLNWYEDTANFIRRLDRNHLISTGENNFGTMDKSKFESVHSVDGIDMASVHIYIDDLYSIEKDLKSGEKVDHFISYWTNASHHDLRKPIIFGEVGANVSNSGYFYGKFVQEAYKLDADGVIVWSWMEGADCLQDIAYGGYCISPERTPAIADELKFWAGKFREN
jgi:endo-1,4-beta-mannosidase